VLLVLRGHSNEQIAAQLEISTYTVKEYLKAVFAKVGVASRSELGARLFTEQYLPRILAATGH
jgi:DNA-binding NarL/FixJ family response regulator